MIELIRSVAQPLIKTRNSPESSYRGGCCAFGRKSDSKDLTASGENQRRRASLSGAANKSRDTHERRERKRRIQIRAKTEQVAAELCIPSSSTAARRVCKS
jgi:hypothetical protein